MEKLVVLCYVWAFGLSDKADYYAELDRLFLENPEDDFLLELEGLGNDFRAACSRLSCKIEEEIGVERFGKELLAALEKHYNESIFSLEEFGELCYNIYCALPGSIAFEYPFLSLCYALDEPVFGEVHSRQWFQKLFNYYKEKP